MNSIYLIAPAPTASKFAFWSGSKQQMLMRVGITSFCVALCLSTASVSLAREIQLDSEPYIKLGTPAISRTKLGNAGAQLFEVRFNNESFTGDVIARSVDSLGSVSEDVFDSNGLISTDNSLWRASRTLLGRSPASRRIFTTESNGASKDFKWGSLSAEAKFLIDRNAEPTSTTNPILDWIRGDSSNEGTLRKRTVKWIGGTTFHNKMGSVVNSSPAYVGPPSEFYTENGYAAFRLANRNREAMVYVGANDGMLHAFEAGDGGADNAPGAEVFAYVPHSVLDVLGNHTLADVDFQTFSVDGSPVVQDAYGPFPRCGGGSCWRTILVSGLRGGGRGVFALDVTDPASDVKNTGHARASFLWEFLAKDKNGDGQIDASDAGGNADLGYTYSRPIIVQLSDGTWVAIFGNGYNSTGSGNPSLYIMNLATGVLIKRIEASRPLALQDEKPNGLSSVVGWDADFDNKVDYVYAGDLDGNLWKFDLRNGSPASLSNLKVAFSGEPLIQVVNSTLNADGNKIYIPITNAPVVTLHPNGGQMVYFGNGIALDATHESIIGDRGVYGIHDDKPAGDTYSPPYGVYPTGAVRLTKHTVGQNSSGVLRGIKSTLESSHNVGWVLELGANEQALTDMSVSSQRLNVMSVESIIDVNNFNWLHTVDYLTGGAPTSPVFDANLDGDIDASDTISVVGGASNVVPIGGAVGKAVASAPLIVTSSNNNDVFILTLAIEVTTEFNSPFTDPGLKGGHIDVDETYFPKVSFTLNNAPFATLWDKKRTRHTHEYDDDHDTNGVQMLFNPSNNATPTIPPNVETANSIGSKYHGLYDGVNNGKFFTAGKSKLALADEVTIHILNPHSVDTQKWADERFAKGVSDNKIAGPATFYFGCSSKPALKNYRSNPDLIAQGIYTGGITAPNFAELPIADRTCSIADLTELRVRFNDINSVRAVEPKCSKENNVQGPLLPPTALLSSGQKQNTTYRNGTFTVAATMPNGEVIWEFSIYEHLKDITFPSGRGIGCGTVNEDLRQFRDLPDGGESSGGGDPDAGGGGGTDPADVEFPGQGGFQGFIGTPSITLDPYTGRSDDTTDFLSIRPPSKRVNWREAKDWK